MKIYQEDKTCTTDDYVKPKMVRTRKAFDWLCACLIRLPIWSLWVCALLAFGMLISFMVSPDNTLNLLRLLGVRV